MSEHSSNNAQKDEQKNDFIRNIIRDDVKAQKYPQIVTRFPPEPNGYLHINNHNKNDSSVIIPANAIKKIENKIAGSLKNCEIKDNFPEFASLSSHVGSLAEEVLSHRGVWLDQADVFSIFYDFVDKSINSARHQPSVGSAV